MTILRSDRLVIDSSRFLVDTWGRLWIVSPSDEVKLASYAQVIAAEQHFGPALHDAAEAVKALG